MSYANAFYSSKKGGVISFFEYDEDGQRQLIEEEYKPYCYVPAKDGEYKDILGNRCKKKEFNNFYQDQRSYVESHKTYEGDIKPEDRFLIDKYHDKNILDNIPKLQIHFIDIETDSAGGFPDATRITDEILLITVYSNVTEKYHVWGVKDYTPKAKNVEYNYCDDEQELLRKYLRWHNQNMPDVITGWNIKTFDMPYIVDRTKHYSENMYKRLSPFKNVRDVHTKDNNYDVREVNIAGCVQLDYLKMYKEFSINKKESYTLNYISHIELGIEKIKFDGTLFDLWKRDWETYVDYNIRDSELVKLLDDKLAFIDLVQVQAYICKVPLEKVKSAINKFDNYLISLLKSEKIVLPTAKRKTKEEIIGGFVSEPQRGYFRNICSFDFTSLYPHIIFALNLSPETFVGVVLKDNCLRTKYEELDMSKLEDDTEYHILDRSGKEKAIIGSKLKKWMKKKRYILSPNGLIFKSEEGFIPKVVQGVFQKRKDYKKTMTEFKKLYEKSKDVHDKDAAHKFHLYQYAMKIFANSIYGIMANENFRFFNPDFARAITLTGRKVIQYTSHNVNDFFKEKFALDYDVCIYSDTDSIYVNYLSVVEDIELTNTKELVDTINTFNKENLDPFFDEIFNKFSVDLMNSPKNWFDLKRESIATGAIFIEPKKYACRLIDKEFVTFDEPKLDVKGMEIVRSSTPSFCREYIKEIVELIIDTVDRQTVIDDVRDIRKKFYVEEVEAISFPRGVNTLNKWIAEDGSLLSGCPIQVRASANYNTLLKHMELDNKYDEIQQGTKIKFIYIKENNNVIQGQNIIGYSEVLPEEFGLHKYIDLDIQFEKSFMSPIKKMFVALGWGLPNLSCDDLTNSEFF